MLVLRPRRGGVVQEPAPLPRLAHYTVVGVAQRDLEMRNVAHEHLAEPNVPFVQFERAVDISVAVGQIGRDPFGGEPAPHPFKNRIVLGCFFWGESLFGAACHRTPPIKNETR